MGRNFMSSEDIFFFKSSAASSFPIIPTRVTSIPKSERFFATLAAPPGLSSHRFISIIGTGASGEILFTDPIQYLSNIKSPTTKIFCLLIILFQIIVSQSECLLYFPVINLK